MAAYNRLQNIAWPDIVISHSICAVAKFGSALQNYPQLTDD
jgi:hypothetical protein